MCGECCSSWNIPLEASKALQLLERPWVKERLTNVNRQLVAVDHQLYRIPLTDQNNCVFLATDNRCMIEIHEGARLKPKECQRFPFAEINMPDGATQHESSAACKLISEKLLLAFQPILPKPTSSLEINPDPSERMNHFPRQVPLGFYKTISMEAYAAYEDSLYRILTSDICPETALKQIQSTLNPKSRKVPIPIQFQYVSLIQRFLTLFFLRKPYRSHSWLDLFLNKTYFDPRIFGLPIYLGQQRVIPWNSHHNRHLNAFLYGLLQRKWLLANGGSLTSLLAMAAVASLLVQWHAKTLAWLQQSQEISAMDVSTAIRLVERYYTGHQPQFIHFFTSRWKGKLIAKLLLG
jgi:hypothetical protein